MAFTFIIYLTLGVDLSDYMWGSILNGMENDL